MTEVDGVEMISATDWPFELEAILEKWLVSISRDEVRDVTNPHHGILVMREHGTYITQHGYGLFLRWVVEVLWGAVHKLKEHPSNLAEGGHAS